MVVKDGTGSEQNYLEPHTISLQQTPTIDIDR